MVVEPASEHILLLDSSVAMQRECADPKHHHLLRAKNPEVGTIPSALVTDANFFIKTFKIHLGI